MVGNRRHITPSVKQQLVTMSAYILPCEISHVTQISKRTVNRVLRLQRRTGSVLQRPLQAGRPRTLNGLDIAYLEACIEWTPDMYLQELREELFQAREVDISVATIHRSLHRRGFSHKQVSGSHLQIFPSFMR
ncbi:hypothetical protein DFH94DRAFT_624763 [Russula ochroleuca]|uniref:Paired domain-containing protein n=1 Tax=Russula ochroleuca TaxID=152965 RepID=A0A9P5TCQ1_9AGAM|nr:hypothetical protein DFH94DRAFT_624763 [Russula ochroleuca]